MERSEHLKMSLLKTQKILLMLVGLTCPILLSVILTEFCLLFNIKISPSIIMDKLYMKTSYVVIANLLPFLIIIYAMSLLADVLIKYRKSIIISIFFISGIIPAFIIWDRFISLYTDRYENIITHSTMWASGFSDENFIKIKKNHSKEDVVRIVGNPLRSFKSDFNEVVLVYSDLGNNKSKAEKGYLQRWLVLRDNRVIKIHRRYITAEHDPLKGIFWPLEK